MKKEIFSIYACDSCEHKENNSCPFLPLYRSDLDDGEEYNNIACSDYKRFK